MESEREEGEIDVEDQLFFLLQLVHLSPPFSFSNLEPSFPVEIHTNKTR
jgi:hypothetical protein